MKKKGFTLVELLAVIAILAILIIMALPAVLRLFRNMRISSFENEVKNIYRQAKNQMIIDSLYLNANETKLYASDITSNRISSGYLELQGENNLKYCVLVDNSGNIIKMFVTNDTYQFVSNDIVNDINDIYVEDRVSENITGKDNCLTKVTFKYNDGVTPDSVQLIQYGGSDIELPIPTRSGYIFKGWNGKNKFKVQGEVDPRATGLKATYDPITEIFTINGEVVSQGDLYLSRGPLDLEAGKPITLSVIHTGGTASVGSGSGITYSYSIFSQDHKVYIRDGRLSNTAFPEYFTFTESMIEDSGGVNTAFVLQLWRLNTTFDNYKIKIQIEEGTTATSYEPFYIPNNKILSPNDQILTAIWE